jgi:hypothetical protein
VKTASGLLLAAAVAAVSCNGSIRFDETPRDAGAGGNATCPSGACGWADEDCDAGVCRLACHESMMCVGVCTAPCAARCETTSHCALTTPPSASVRCSSGATCTFVLGDRSHAECEDTATCGVRCVAGCTLECESLAGCDLQCSDGAVTHVTGSVTCP